MDFFEYYFDKISNSIKNVDTLLLEEGARLIHNACERGGKTIIAGNGGSAALASHVSVDLTKSVGIRAINFNEADLITCFANDYGYEKWLEKAVEFYADVDDVLILISSSGVSRNILNGALKGRELGLKIITLSGFRSDNPLKQLGDINLWVDSSEYNVVEITHSVWLLAVVDKLMGSTQKTKAEKRG
jgi:D-sedoheptulose 7-phosphate isomerase